MPAELHDLDPDEVSLVGKAANRRVFLIRKGADMPLDEVKALELVDRLDKAGLGGVLESLAQPDSVELQKAKAEKPTGMDDETWAKYCSAMKIMGPQLAKRFKMAPADEPEPHEDDMMPDKKKKVAKSDELPEDVRVALEKAAEDRERLTKAEARLAEMTEKDERRTFIAKAGEFASIPGAAADDLGTILQKASKALEPKQYERLLAILKAAHETIKTGEVFKEQGADAEAGPATAYEMIQAEAAKLLEKSASPITPEQAKARVIKARPDLMKRMNDEQDERIRKGR